MSEIVNFYNRHSGDLSKFFGNVESFCVWVGNNHKVQALLPDEKHILDQIIDIRREDWNKKNYVRNYNGRNRKT